MVSGCIGPRGDGYQAGEVMTAEEAERYHAVQIRSFAATTADQVSALTMPTGQSLVGAIEQVDAATDGAAAYFMVNCAHPTHFDSAFDADGPWRRRLLGLRANASERSHAELDESTDLDEGDPIDLAARYVALRERMPALTVLGGCCGTDARHVAAICAAWTAVD